MVLGWHELLLWRGNEGWRVVCSKEKVQHYEKVCKLINLSSKYSCKYTLNSIKYVYFIDPLLLDTPNRIDFLNDPSSPQVLQL